MKHIPIIIIANFAQYWTHIEPVLKGALLVASLVYTIFLLIEHFPAIKSKWKKRKTRKKNDWQYRE